MDNYDANNKLTAMLAGEDIDRQRKPFSGRVLIVVKSKEHQKEFDAIQKAISELAFETIDVFEQIQYSQIPKVIIEERARNSLIIADRADPDNGLYFGGEWDYKIFSNYIWICQKDLADKYVTFSRVSDTVIYTDANDLYERIKEKTTKLLNSENFGRYWPYSLTF